MSSSKPHYFAVGVFVLASAFLGLAGVVLIGSDALRSPEYFIETYVNESVQGIDIGTPFKFRGVKVGSVCEVKMVSEEYDTAHMYVLIRVAFDSKALLNESDTLSKRIEEQVVQGLRLQLVPQGITGLSFLEADFFPDAGETDLEVDWVPHYTYVPSRPAMMTLLTRSLERIANEVNGMDLKAVASNVESTMSNLNLSAGHIERITRNAAEASGDISQDLRAATEELPALTSNLLASVYLLNEIVNSADRDVYHILSNLRYMSEDARDLIQGLQQHPGRIMSKPPERTLKREEKDDEAE